MGVESTCTRTRPIRDSTDAVLRGLPPSILVFSVRDKLQPIRINYVQIDMRTDCRFQPRRNHILWETRYVM